MQKLLSIIVPVFKVEEYINKCLDSLVLDEKALMDKLEVIVVNDGTPDRSAELSREYVRRYPDTFRQIDKENGGHGSAWNVGLREATGKYIRFLDSDDWLSNLNVMISKLEHCNSDIVLTNYQVYHQKRNEFDIRRVSLQYGKEFSLCTEVLHELRQGYIEINFWYACYKAAILKPLYPLFAEKVMYDDSVLSFAPLAFGRTVIAFDFVLYNYLLGREGQSMDAGIQKKNAESYLKCLFHEERIRLYLADKEIPEDLMICIDEVIAQYAHFVFPFFANLPYNLARRSMAYVVNKYPLAKSESPSSIWRRYTRYPWWFFYTIERVRKLYSYFVV